MFKKPLCILSVLCLNGVACAQPFPTLNVRLRHVCLSVADNTSGAIDVTPLMELPSVPVGPYLHVIEEWSPQASRAKSTIDDGNGGRLTVMEVMKAKGSCSGDFVKSLVFSVNSEGYISRVCLSSSGKSFAHSVEVTIQAAGSSNTAILGIVRRVFAAGLCFEPRGLNAEYGGFTIDGETVTKSLP